MSIAADRRRRLDWFEEHRGEILPLAAINAGDMLLTTKASGIFKPKDWQYSLSIRIVPGSQYGDGGVESVNARQVSAGTLSIRPSISWSGETPARRSAASRRGDGRLDLAHGADHGRSEVFSGGECLADLGGQAAPFGDGQGSGDAAQRDLHGDVVAADD